MTPKPFTIRKLPARLYVRRVELPNDEPCLEAADTPKYAEDGDLVGVYELVETKTMIITRTLQAPLPTADQARALRVKRRMNGPQRVASRR